MAARISARGFAANFVFLKNRRGIGVLRLRSGQALKAAP
jgi:hypothetical protein